MDGHVAGDESQPLDSGFVSSPAVFIRTERDDRKTRDAFLPLFDKHHVDLVLTGHDHTYARSFRLVNGIVVTDDVPGTVYIVSSSGPKFYEYTSPYDSLMARSGVNIQLYQIITVDGGRLSYRAWTADGALYDSFDLRSSHGVWSGRSSCCDRQ